MWSFIYRSEIQDLETKISGSTGLSPSFIKSAWVPEVAIIFNDDLTSVEKHSLDEFMKTRRLSFHRKDEYITQTTGSSGVVFEPKYVEEEYNSQGRLLNLSEYASKGADENFADIRKKTSYTYNSSGILLNKKVDTYNASGSVEDTATYNYSTQKTSNNIRVKIRREGT